MYDKLLLFQMDVTLIFRWDIYVSMRVSRLILCITRLMRHSCPLDDFERVNIFNIIVLLIGECRL